MIWGYYSSPRELASDVAKIVFGSIGIPGFDDSLWVIVPLNEVTVVFGRVFVLRFGTPAFDTTVETLNILRDGVWQS
jgi:hypothetical protein